MKLVKSLLLGSAAGLVAVAGAQAADLPVRKAAPVDYVRICSTYGAGYFFIPGSDTCLRISGYVQAEYQYFEQERDDFDEFGMRARIRLNLDLRQPTEYGLLRAFARMDFRRQSGPYVSAGEPGVGTVSDRFGIADQAYIQFGGLTAGRAQSFFDFYTYDDVFTTQLTASDVKTQLLAYTFSFGGGFSGTISLEDNAERRNFGTAITVPAGFAGVVVPAGTAPFFGTPGVVNNFGAEGTKVPDVVANLRFDQAWGSAQLSGALHELNSLNTFAPFGTTVVSRADDEIGFAIQAGVMFKLPFIAPGDELWLQATYADGASSYAGIPSQATIGRFSTVRPGVTDAFVDQFGNTQTSEVFAVSGKFKHYWLPNLRMNIFGGYSRVEYDGASVATVFPIATPGVGGVQVGFADLDIMEIGANLIWTPVKQLDIGVEAVYRKFETKGNVANTFAGGTFGPTGAFVGASSLVGSGVGDDDVIEARLRIQRDF